MTDARLIPCSACARHVRASEAACPFCSAAMPVTPAARPLPRSTGTRLSRAALFALGASAAAAGACGTNDVPMYGAPGVAQDGGGSERAPTPPYGAPPVDGGEGDEDASEPEDAGADAADGSADADADAEGGPPVPPYGAPPP